MKSLSVCPLRPSPGLARSPTRTSSKSPAYQISILTMAKKKKKCKPTSGWSSIPGNKLDVDIKYGSSAPIEEDEFDVSKWTSPHYGDDESVSSRAERDLWQDNDKYDAASRETDGEFGMLFSLEVIPGVFLVCTVNLH